MDLAPVKVRRSNPKLVLIRFDPFFEKCCDAKLAEASHETPKNDYFKEIYKVIKNAGGVCIMDEV